MDAAPSTRNEVKPNRVQSQRSKNYTKMCCPKIACHDSFNPYLFGHWSLSLLCLPLTALINFNCEFNEIHYEEKLYT